MRHYKYRGSDNANIKFLKECGGVIDMYTFEKIVRSRQGWRGSRFGKYLLNTYNYMPNATTLYKISMCMSELIRNYNRKRRNTKLYYKYNCSLYKEYIKNNNINKDVMIVNSGIKL
jgi:hypothetical protein